METDAFIQNSLRQNFSCTLLTIAHRLNTICDYDRVLVLSFGLVKEFASPAELLRDPNSTFSSMVNETGEVNANLLRTIAFNAEKGIKLDAKVLLGADAEEGRDQPQEPAGSPTGSDTPGAPAEANNGREASVSQSHVRWHASDEQ